MSMTSPIPKRLDRRGMGPRAPLPPSPLVSGTKTPHLPRGFTTHSAPSVLSDSLLQQENHPLTHTQDSSSLFNGTDLGLNHTNSMSLTSAELHTSVLQGTSTPAPKSSQRSTEKGIEETPERSLGFSRSSSNSTRGVLSATNPFESMLMRSLDQNTFSPSVFSKIVSPTESISGESFRWSIEHQAMLHPADIDEVPTEEQVWAESMRADPETEANYQAAIESFWARNRQIAPSPLDSPIFRSRLAHHLHNSIAKNSPTGRPPAFHPEGLARSAAPTPLRTSSPRPPNSRYCQTLLTFPPFVDLVSLLGTEFLHKEEEAESGEKSMDLADLSTSSLRRKLFAANTEELFQDPEPHLEVEEEEWSSGAESPPLFLSTVDEGDCEDETSPDEPLRLSPIAPMDETAFIRSSPVLNSDQSPV